MKNRTYKTDTGCPNDCDCLGFGHGGLEIDTSADDIKREVLEILEAADTAAPSDSPTIDAKPCWKCWKAWPLSKRKCSCGRKLSRLPTFVSLDSKAVVWIPASADNLRADGSYTFWLTPGVIYYGDRRF